MDEKELLKATVEAFDTPSTRSVCPNEDECCCPDKVVYVVFTKCLVINNAACRGWKFCKVWSCDGPEDQR